MAETEISGVSNRSNDRSHRTTLESLQISDDESSPPDAATVLAPTTRSRQIAVLISSFVAVVITIGPNLSYGVFQEYYVTDTNSILPPDEAANRAAVALVGTLGAGLTWGGSIFVNPLMSRVPGNSNRKIAIAGCVLMTLAYIFAGFCHHFWQLLLTQGALYGIGSSMVYFPLLSVAPEYFDRHRGAAMGFILSGAGIGGLILSPIYRVLLSAVGGRWCLRILGVATFVITLPLAITAAPRRSITRRPTLVNMAIAKKPAFILQAVAALLQASGNFVPMTFLPEFSTTIGYSASVGSTLLAVNNGVNAVSRVLMGYAADKMGRQNMLIIGVIGSAVSVYSLWLSSASDGGKASWVTFVVVYGVLAGGKCFQSTTTVTSLGNYLFSGGYSDTFLGYNALFPTTITDVFGVHAYASVNGFLYFVRGLGALFGSPVGGLILGSSRTVSSGKDIFQLLGDYQKLIWYDGALLMGSSLCVIGVRGFDAVDKRKWTWKA